MIDRSNHTEKLVQKAQEKILGTKFCFSCQKPKPLEAGKLVPRGNGRVWRCKECAAKQSPMGFKKEKNT